MPAVADASPLILLAKLDRLSLLPQLYRQVLIPPAVVRELQAKRDPTFPALERFISTATVQAPGIVRLLQALSGHLGSGESEAIALAAEISDAILVMDDAEGRQAARELGLRVTGLLGVMVEGKAKGLLPRVAPVLDELVAAGFWLSEAMRSVVLRSVGE